VPATAEQLMRSRFSAFAVGDAAYLGATWHPSTRPSRRELDAAVGRDRRWTRLEVLRSTGGFLDSEGTVEFRAHWAGAGGPGVMAETSRFVRADRTWLYVGPVGAAPGPA
jgi:SEC-C motif-containing protein